MILGQAKPNLARVYRVFYWTVMCKCSIYSMCKH